MGSTWQEVPSGDLRSSLSVAAPVQEEQMPDSVNSTESGPVRLYVVFAEDGETTLDGFIEKLQSVAEFTVRRRYESANAVIIQTDASSMVAISETDFVLEAREEGQAELTAGSVGETEGSLPTSDPTDSEGQQTADIQQAGEEFREDAAELQTTEEVIRETGDELQTAEEGTGQTGDELQTAEEGTGQTGDELQISEEVIREAGDKLQEAGDDARADGDQTADTQQTGEAVRVTEDTQSEIQQSSEAEEQPEDETEVTFTEVQAPADVVSQSKIPVRGIFIGAAAVVFAVIVLFIALRVGRR